MNKEKCQIFIVKNHIIASINLDVILIFNAVVSVKFTRSPGNTACMHRSSPRAQKIKYWHKKGAEYGRKKGTLTAHAINFLTVYPLTYLHK